MTMQLPPLPKSHHAFADPEGEQPDIPAFSLDQMQAYATLACASRDALITDLVKALHTASWALREPLDGWKGEVSRKALDEIGAVLAKVPK